MINVMIENLNRYKELVTQYNIKKRELNSIQKLADDVQDRYEKIELNKLIDDKNNLISTRELIIKNKIFKLKKYLKYLSMIAISLLCLGCTTIKGLDIGIIFLTFIYSSICFSAINKFLCNMVKTIFEHKNSKIRKIDLLIEDTDQRIEMKSIEKKKLYNEKKKIITKLNWKRREVQLLEELINSVKIEWATPIIEKEIECLDNANTKSLTRIRKM